MRFHKAHIDYLIIVFIFGVSPFVSFYFDLYTYYYEIFVYIVRYTIHETYIYESCLRPRNVLIYYYNNGNNRTWWNEMMEGFSRTIMSPPLLRRDPSYWTNEFSLFTLEERKDKNHCNSDLLNTLQTGIHDVSSLLLITFNIQPLIVTVSVKSYFLTS